MSGPERPTPRTAAGIRYDGGDAPRLVASGRGRTAERILELAREHGIPVREDAELADALAQLEVDRDVPPELWQAVAQALVWAYRLSGRSIPGGASR
jgi:flagellar biosynthesis protein